MEKSEEELLKEIEVKLQKLEKEGYKPLNIATSYQYLYNIMWMRFYELIDKYGKTKS